MRDFYDYEESFCVEQYEIASTRITRTDYDFRSYRECSVYESARFWMEDSEEVYFNIRATRIA